MQAAVLWASGAARCTAVLGSCHQGSSVLGAVGPCVDAAGKRLEVLRCGVVRTGASSLLHRAQVPRLLFELLASQEGPIQIHSQAFDGCSCVVSVCFWQAPHGSAAYCSLLLPLLLPPACSTFAQHTDGLCVLHSFFSAHRALRSFVCQAVWGFLTATCGCWCCCPGPGSSDVVLCVHLLVMNFVLCVVLLCCRKASACNTNTLDGYPEQRAQLLIAVQHSVSLHCSSA